MNIKRYMNIKGIKKLREHKKSYVNIKDLDEHKSSMIKKKLHKHKKAT